MNRKIVLTLVSLLLSSACQQAPGPTQTPDVTATSATTVPKTAVTPQSQPETPSATSEGSTTLEFNGQSASIVLPEGFRLTQKEPMLVYAHDDGSKNIGFLRNPLEHTEKDLLDPELVTSLGQREGLTYLSDEMLTTDAGAKAKVILVKLDNGAIQSRVVMEGKGGWVLLISANGMSEADFNSYSTGIVKSFKEL